jgi:hypothetical protein
MALQIMDGNSKQQWGRTCSLSVAMSNDEIISLETARGGTQGKGCILGEGCTPGEAHTIRKGCVPGKGCMPGKRHMPGDGRAPEEAYGGGMWRRHACQGKDACQGRHVYREEACTSGGGMHAEE